jgi:NTE family protein
MMSMTEANAKPANLALQGGGAHGAFTWGVLDRLLETGALKIAGISGTSAGAMNAVVLADGFKKGGPDGARASLERFWRRMSEEARASLLQPNPFDILLGRFNLDTSPTYVLFDVVSRFFSPYDINPRNHNPLRDVLCELVDFDAVRSCDAFDIFISATNVHTGKARVFRNHELSVDAVLASACLPFLFQAVEIDGVPYWDGGYGGNPVLWPFFYAGGSADIVLVQINPIERAETPKSAREILNRVNEITFNAALLREFRAIDFVGRLVEEGRLDGTRYRKMRIHRVDGAGAMADLDLNASSKLNTSWAFLTTLKECGRTAASSWIAETHDRLGKHSTIDLRVEYS